MEFKNLPVIEILALITFATVHGYAGAWLAVRMLFRPRNPVKILGLTIFPQGMIPRHRDRLANAIGKAVGEELVSQETVLDELFEKDFLRRKINGVVDSYTEELLSQNYPSLIEALPSNLREPILDAISAAFLTVTLCFGAAFGVGASRVLTARGFSAGTSTFATTELSAAIGSPGVVQCSIKRTRSMADVCP